MNKKLTYINKLYKEHVIENDTDERIDIIHQVYWTR